MKACAVPKDGKARVAAPEGAGKEIAEKLKHLSATDAQQVPRSGPGLGQFEFRQFVRQSGELRRVNPRLVNALRAVVF